MSNDTKVTVTLPDWAIEALRHMSEQRNVSMTEVLLSAVATEKFLSDKNKENCKILILDTNRNLTQLISKFPR
jgi:hypothetical protein